MRTTLMMIALSGAGLLAASLAFADDARPVTPTPVSATSQQAEPVICHAIVHEGSVVHRSECHTQREWNRIRWEQQQGFREFQQRSLEMGR